MGNTGNTTAPHPHFGLLDAPDPLVGNSLPMVFDHRTWQGTLSPEGRAAAFAASAEPAEAPASPVAAPPIVAPSGASALVR